MIESVVKLINLLKSRKMLALLMLGFASGLPAAQGDGLLPFWLKDQGFSDKATAQLAALTIFPYALKFIWSPILDRYAPPFLGRRKGWLIITQIVLLILLGMMALQHPDSKNIDFFKAVVVLVAFVSATQDIAGDAYRTDVLPNQDERATGAALWTNGFRVAYLLAGSLIILFVKQLTWNGVYFLVAGLMLVGIVASLFAPDPINEEIPPKSFADAVILPFQDFFQRKGLLDGLAIMTFILVYKLGDNLARIGGKYISSILNLIMMSLVPKQRSPQFRQLWVHYLELGLFSRLV
jgi:MFS transporter, PAT family, beta-lactamase induction signal transducer AmpG